MGELRRKRRRRGREDKNEVEGAMDGGREGE